MSNGREKLKKIQVVINLLVFANSLIPKFLNKRLFVFFRNTPWKIGLMIRYIIFKNLSKACGNNVSIHPGVYMEYLSSISIGNNVSIHPMCYIDGENGVTIGNDVSIAHSTTIMTTSHSYENKEIPIKYNHAIAGPVNIKDDVWIGCGCRILFGITINNRSIIAAGAVVNKDVQSSCIVGGVPAKFIKSI